MTKKLLRVSLLLIFMIGVFGVSPTKARAATLDQNNIASDSVFQNTSTMNAHDINLFLNRYTNSCISPNSGFSSVDPTGYSPSGGYTYGQSVSAGAVIYDAAQAYGINPQVLITTLQKEQSLVTGGGGCDNLAYTGAMGYGCPDGGTTYSYSNANLYSTGTHFDSNFVVTTAGSQVTSVSGTCVNSLSKAGFTAQVIHGAWLLRFGQQRALGNTAWNVQLTNAPQNGDHWDNSDDPPSCYGGPMTQGNRSRAAMGGCAQPTYYDGYFTIDSTTVHIDTGATAALYWYTPHFHGNQSFVTIFQDTFGFGSTNSGQLSIAHPDGTLVRPAAGPNASHVYVLKDGGASYATSLGVFMSWGFDFGQVKIATQGDLSLMAASDLDTAHTTNPAPLQYREGSVVRGSGPIVYIIQNVSGVNHKRSLDSIENFVRLGYTFGEVLNIPDSELTVIPTDDPYGASLAPHANGTLIRDSNSPIVYYLINGERHSMTSGNILFSHHFTWSSVKIATAGDNLLPITWPVTWYGEGTMLKGAGSTVYIVDLDATGVNMKKRSFGTYYNFVGLDYRFAAVRLVSDDQLPTLSGPDIGLN